jgi:hypothetical protein
MVTRALSRPFRIAKQAINFSAILPYTPQPHEPGPNQTRRIGRSGVVSSQHDGIKLLSPVGNSATGTTPASNCAVAIARVVESNACNS